MDDGLQVRKTLTVVFGARYGALREMMTSKSASEAYVSSGRHGVEFPSSTSVALASMVAATVTDTVVWSSDGNLATSVFYVSLFPAERCFAKRMRAAKLTPSA